MLSIDDLAGYFTMDRREIPTTRLLMDARLIVTGCHAPPTNGPNLRLDTGRPLNLLVTATPTETCPSYWFKGSDGFIYECSMFDSRGEFIPEVGPFRNVLSYGISGPASLYIIDPKNIQQVPEDFQR